MMQLDSCTLRLESFTGKEVPYCKVDPAFSKEDLLRDAYLRLIAKPNAPLDILNIQIDNVKLVHARYYVLDAACHVTLWKNIYTQPSSEKTDSPEIPSGTESGYLCHEGESEPFELKFRTGGFVDTGVTKFWDPHKIEPDGDDWDIDDISMEDSSLCDEIADDAFEHYADDWKWGTMVWDASHPFSRNASNYELFNLVKAEPFKFMVDGKKLSIVQDQNGLDVLYLSSGNAMFSNGNYQSEKPDSAIYHPLETSKFCLVDYPFYFFTFKYNGKTYYVREKAGTGDEPYLDVHPELEFGKAKKSLFAKFAEKKLVKSKIDALSKRFQELGLKPFDEEDQKKFDKISKN